jgi:nicotinamidase-related amidase
VSANALDSLVVVSSSTDNTVLWTSADAHQNHYKVVVVEDCTMCHRQQEPPGAKEGALRIIRNVLHGEVLPLKEVVEKYLRPL